MRTEPGAAPATRRGILRWTWALGALACTTFAGMAVTFPLAIGLGKPDAWAVVQGAVTSAGYTFGPHSSEAQHPLYLHALRSFSLHTIAGGAALLLATTQFMPVVRRRWPRLHRAAGACVVALVAASMVGALLVQASHPLAASLSGAGFGIGLASLAGLTLAELILAVLAVRAGAYRSHMGWMALMFASLLTAPALRVQWLVLGRTGLTMDETNLLVAMYLIPQTILVMALWTSTVGARDLGLDPPRSILPIDAVRVLAALAALVTLHEGCLAPLGLDLIHAWRGGGHTLPSVGVVWGLATALLAARAPGDLMRISGGSSVRSATILCALGAAGGALAIAFALSGGGAQTIAERSFYGAWGLEIALLMLLGRRSVFGQAPPWDVQWLYLALVPGLWPLLACSYIPLAVGASVAITTAMAVSYATIAMLGFASAFGLRVVVARRSTSSLLSPAAA